MSEREAFKILYEALREAERGGVSLGDFITRLELLVPELRETDDELEELRS